MKCMNCNNEANTHIKKIINGKKEELFLCDECAERLGVMDDFKLESFGFEGVFDNLLGTGSSMFNSLVGVDRCSVCGSTYKEILDNGLVGCSHCYERFSDRLGPSINRIHGHSKHIGKNVTYFNAVEEQNELVELKRELKQAIKEQRFEDAAVLRDKIKELDKEI